MGWKSVDGEEGVFSRLLPSPALEFYRNSPQDTPPENFFCDAQIATDITHFYRKGTLYFSKHLSKGLPSL